MSIDIIKQVKKDEYIVDGAELKCTLGMKTCKLMVPMNHGVLIHEKKRANIADFIPMVNIGSFVTCKVTQAPCIPVIVTPWINGNMNIILDNMPALTKDSFVICSCGGIVSINDSGQ